MPRVILTPANTPDATLLITFTLNSSREGYISRLDFFFIFQGIYPQWDYQLKMVKQQQNHFFIFRYIHSCLLPLVCHPLSNEIVAGFQKLCGIDEKGNTNNKFFYYLFKLASTTGEEIFSLMPLLFWLSIDLAVPFVTNFGFVLTAGQLVKDVLLLPRPPRNWKNGSRPIAKLEKHFETEYGFPSTHTMSGLFVMVVLMAMERQGVTVSDEWKLASWLYMIIVAFSRLYMGVHSPVDIIGGFSIGYFIIQYLDVVGDAFDNFVYKSPMGIYFSLFTLLLYLTAYPRARPWSASYGTATQIYGTWIGVSLSLYYIYVVNPSLAAIMDSVAINKPVHSVTFYPALYRILSGFVLVAIAKFGVKIVALKFFLLLHAMKLLPSDPREEVDAGGVVVPPAKLYWVEVPVR